MNDTSRERWSVGRRVLGGVAFLLLLYVGSFAVLIVDDLFGQHFFSDAIRAACPESSDRIFAAMRLFYSPLLVVVMGMR